MKNLTFYVFFVAAFICITCSQSEFSPEKKWILDRFWESGIMKSEGLFFIQENESEPPCASLLFKPDKILSLTNAPEDIIYTEGKDYLYTPGSRMITLTKDTRIPYMKREDMYPPVDSPKSIRKYRFGEKNLFFSEGHVFHDLQAAVTYKHDGQWMGYVPEFAGKNLPVTIRKLKNRKPLTIVLYGNSISKGYNASGHTGAPPYMPPYGNLIAINLEYLYNAKIHFVNHSVGGKRTDWGIENIGKVTAENPDLVIIAFGMNDASGKLTPDEYSGNVRKMIGLVREQCPAAEFILVATMTGNPEWSRSSPELYPAYRNELTKLCGEGTVLADMTSVWTEILKYKKFTDITGNGVNHPNDFGHRTYAEVILGLLTE